MSNRRPALTAVRTAVVATIAVAPFAFPPLGGTAALASPAVAQTTVNGMAASETAVGETMGTTSPSDAFTYSDELITFQIPATWQESTYAKGTVTYHVFSSGDATVQVATIPSDYALDAPDVTEAYMEALVGDFETDGAEIGETTRTSVGGVPLGSYPYVRDVDGSTITGIVTMVGGANYSSMVISSFPADAPAETIAAVQLVHESVRPVEGAQGSRLSEPEGPAGVLFDGDYQPHDQGVVSFAIDGMRYIVANGEATLLTQGSDEPPTTQVSVGVRNEGDEVAMPIPLRVEATGPSGIACDVFSLEDDTVRFGGMQEGMEPGDELMTFFELSYDGPGVYVVALYEPDEGIDDAVIFTVEL